MYESRFCSLGAPDQPGSVALLGPVPSPSDPVLVFQVVMLSSVTELLRYIDENQLTPEFGGTLEYCHSDWVVLRTVRAGGPHF